MRFFESLKWLFTNAPLSITNDTEDRKCDYCERTTKDNANMWNWAATGHTICSFCQKKIADKVLKGE